MNIEGRPGILATSPLKNADRGSSHGAWRLVSHDAKFLVRGKKMLTLS